MNSSEQLFGEGVKRSNGEQARMYNLFAARLIADLIKNSFGPRGLEKMFIDILGEVTVTKDGATLLRKIDVEHPAAKVLIDASNAVDNEVGDGTTSVVLLAGALIEKAEESLNMGIRPATILDGYLYGLDISLEILQSISLGLNNTDRKVMEKLAKVCLGSKSISLMIGDENTIAKFIVDAVYTIADFANNQVNTDDIKIEEKIGNTIDTLLIKGTIIDKTIDNSAMPKMVEKAKILLINEDLEPRRTKIDAEIRITSPHQIRSFLDEQSMIVKRKIQNIIDSGANIVISRKGISNFAQCLLAKSDIASIRRVKETDLQWIEKATDAKSVINLDNIFKDQLGYAERVYEKSVGEDKMVFIEGCRNPKSVTLLLRANSKKSLDEYHRSVLDVISVLKDFVMKPFIIGGGGSTEAIIANKIRSKANLIEGRKQIVVQKFADALEEIPLIIARNAGMNPTDTVTQLRSKYSTYSNGKKINRWYGVDAMERKISEMFSCDIIEPTIVKEQILKTAVEVTNLLVRVDDVLIAKPVMNSHTHEDGTKHSHQGGDEKHDHYFDKLGKQQRPMHHYY
jgi:archaeal chaperonin